MPKSVLNRNKRGSTELENMIASPNISIQKLPKSRLEIGEKITEIKNTSNQKNRITFSIV